MAPDLVGATLVVDAGTPDEVRARLVEVEAYLGLDDAASHAARGPTPRAAIMFGEPGRLYVYLSYGMHHCANVVCSPAGPASAVLLRAAALEHGEAVVRRRRGASVPRHRLLSGPGNLCRGLGLDLADNGADLCRGERLRLDARTDVPPTARGPRVGISRAAELPLRFWLLGDPAVSAARSGPGRMATKKGTGPKAGP